MTDNVSELAAARAEIARLTEQNKAFLQAAHMYEHAAGHWHDE